MVDITERLRLNEDDWLFGNTARTAKKEIERLRDELAAAKAEIERLNNDFMDLAERRIAELAAAKAEWLQQIMARDLVIKQLKDAIDRQPYTMDKGVCEAIALQPTTEALDAYVQSAKEEVRDKCAAIADMQHEGFAAAAEIRGMEL